MKRFKDILVVAPPDADMREPMRAAEQLATTNRARITVFDAVEPLTVRRRTTIGGYDADYVQRLIEEARRTELEDIARLAPSVRVRTALATGTLFVEVIRRVQSHDHDLVIIPPDQPGGLTGLGQATTTMHLLRKCPVPVWVYRPELPPGGNVLAAVGPFQDGEPTPLDRKLVELASSLAERRGSRFHVLHAWSLEGESLLRNGRVKMASAEVDDLVMAQEAEARVAVEKLLADTGLQASGAEIHLVKGRAVAAIADLAQRIDARVVVMGTLARTGIAGLLIGNTAEATLGRLSSSVIAVKPDGFQSPIQSTTDRPDPGNPK